MLGNIIVKYIIVFLVSMVPLIELRGAIPIAVGLGLDKLISFVIAIVGNMIPVPIIYLFARKVLEWGKDKKFIGKFFTWCLNKGERGGKKLEAKAGRGLYYGFDEYVYGQVATDYMELVEAIKKEDLSLLLYNNIIKTNLNQKKSIPFI